jgi:hypothetical protein
MKNNLRKKSTLPWIWNEAYWLALSLSAARGYGRGARIAWGRFPEGASNE